MGISARPSRTGIKNPLDEADNRENPSGRDARAHEDLRAQHGPYKPLHAEVFFVFRNQLPSDWTRPAYLAQRLVPPVRELGAVAMV